jgi:hypothetical protein
MAMTAWAAKFVTSAICLSLKGFQIKRIEAFGEPAVDRHE